jgi:hypothetical protein
LKLSVVLGISWHANSKAANGFGNSVTPSILPNDTDASAADERLDNSGRFAYQDESFRDTFWMQRPKAWDSDGNQINIDWRLIRRGNRVFAVFSVPASVLNNPQVIYPVYIDIDIAEESVPSSSYDASLYYSGGSPVYSRTRTVSYFGDGAFDKRECFAACFTSIPVPQGSTIDSADLTYYSVISGVGSCIAKIHSEPADNPAAYPADSATFLIRYGSRTGSGIDWNPVPNWGVGQWKVSPDIASEVQALTDRAGWASGQNMSFFTHDDAGASTNSSRSVEPVDRAGNSNHAKLNISYTEASSGQVIVISQD